MSRYLKFLVWAIIIGAMSYFVFYKENTWVYNYPPIQKTREAINESVNKLKIKLQSGLNKIINSAQEVQEKAMEGGKLVTEKTKERVDVEIQGVKKGVFQTIERAVDTQLEWLRQGLDVGAIATSSSNNILSPPVFFRVKVRVKAQFVLRNQQDEVAQYSVDWRDGIIEHGEIPAENEVIISHQWEKSGNYLAQVTLTSSHGVETYPLSVTAGLQTLPLVIFVFQ